MSEEREVEEEVTTVSHSEPAEVTKTTKTVSPPPIQTEHPQKVYTKKKIIFRTYQVIWYILGFIEILLIFRVLLLMFGSNAGSGFVRLIYGFTDPLAVPFRGIFQLSVTGDGAIFEWSTLVAMLVYALIAYAVIQLMQLAKPTTPEEVHQKVDN